MKVRHLNNVLHALLDCSHAESEEGRATWNTNDYDLVHYYCLVGTFSPLNHHDTNTPLGLMAKEEYDV